MTDKLCTCGKTFTPNNYNQKRCNDCRFAHKNTLSTSDIPVIRKRYANGETAGRIAKDYGVSRTTIFDVTHRTWRHVP